MQLSKPKRSQLDIFHRKLEGFVSITLNYIMLYIVHLNILSVSCFAAPPVPFNTSRMPSSPLGHSSAGHVPDLMHPEDGYKGT